MKNLSNDHFLVSQDIGIGNKFLIEEKLKKRVKEVFTLKDELDDSRKDILYKIFKEMTNKLSEKNILKKFYFKYRKYLIRKNIEKYDKIDYFIIMGNVEFSDYFFEKFIKKFPKVKIILFLWDKLEYSH